MSVTALLRGTGIPICSPNSATDPLSQGNSRRFHCPEHQTTGPIPECTNDIPNTCDRLNIGSRTATSFSCGLHPRTSEPTPTLSTPTSYLDQYVDHDTKARQGWEIHSGERPPGETHAGLDDAVKIHVESPFHRNEQQSQNRQADLP